MTFPVSVCKDVCVAVCVQLHAYLPAPNRHKSFDLFLGMQIWLEPLPARQIHSKLLSTEVVRNRTRKPQDLGHLPDKCSHIFMQWKALGLYFRRSGNVPVYQVAKTVDSEILPVHITTTVDWQRGSPINLMSWSPAPPGHMTSVTEEVTELKITSVCISGKNCKYHLPNFCNVYFVV